MYGGVQNPQLRKSFTDQKVLRKTSSKAATIVSTLASMLTIQPIPSDASQLSEVRQSVAMCLDLLHKVQFQNAPLTKGIFK